jgi:transposase
MPAGPEPLLKAVAPSRAARVVGVACIFPWYWLADLGARAGLPFVLGHALSMQAMHGGTATNDTIDAQTSAVLRRGGLRPQASVSPAALRATRALLRRRMPLRRTRSEWLTPIQNTQSPYHLPEIGKQIAYNAHRDGVAERLLAPAVQQRIDVALALLAHDDCLLREMARTLLKTAKQHEANPLSLLRPVPGLGELLSLVLLYAIHAIHRFPRVHDFVSDCRLVKWAQASAGKRDGTAGAKLGNAYLKWAFAATAARFLCANPAGQKDLTRLEQKHSKGKALTVLAPK